MFLKNEVFLIRKRNLTEAIEIEIAKKISHALKSLYY